MDLFVTLELMKSLLGVIPESVFVAMDICDKVEIVYNFMKGMDLIPPVFLDYKSDGFAVCTIKFLDALQLPFVENVKKFNYGISKAESDRLKAIMLYERAKYFFKNRLYDEFQADVNRALTLDNLTNHQDEIRKFKRQAARLKKVYNRPYGKFHEEVPNIDEVNPKIPNASSSIKIAVDGTSGKRIVATKNIKAGEVIVVEKPFSAICKFKQQLICHECFKRCYNLLPCDCCTLCFYCSDDCKTTAWNTYHKYMCPLMRSLEEIFEMNSVIVLALKITIKNHAKFPNVDNYEDIDVDNEEYSSTSFRTIWKLAKNLEEIRYNQQIFFSYLTVIFYEWLNIHTNFFNDYRATVNRESFMKVLFTVLTVVEKSFPIRYIDDLSYEQCCFNRMGFGLYSVGNLFNHSCCPNAYHTFHGSTLVVRAIRSIKAGEQCCIPYCSIYLYYISDKNFRQQKLITSYHIECVCKACVNNWPHYQFCYDESWTRFRHLIDPNLAKGNVEAAKATLPRLFEKLRRFESKEPNKNAAQLQTLIRVCFQILGNNNCSFNNI